MLSAPISALEGWPTVSEGLYPHIRWTKTPDFVRVYRGILPMNRVFFFTSALCLVRHTQARRVFQRRQYIQELPQDRCFLLQNYGNPFFAPACPLTCSPTHREIGLGVLARAGLLDLLPVLVVLGLKFRDTVLVPGDPQRTIRGMHRGLGFVVPLFLALA
jgi:hypothetical protein